MWTLIPLTLAVSSIVSASAVSHLRSDLNELKAPTDHFKLAEDDSMSLKKRGDEIDTSRFLLMPAPPRLRPVAPKRKHHRRPSSWVPYTAESSSDETVEVRAPPRFKRKGNLKPGSGPATTNKQTTNDDETNEKNETDQEKETGKEKETNERKSSKDEKIKEQKNVSVENEVEGNSEVPESKSAQAASKPSFLIAHMANAKSKMSTLFKKIKN